MFLDRLAPCEDSLKQAGSLNDTNHVGGGGIKGLSASRKDPEGGLKINCCRWDRLSPVRTEQEGLTEHVKDFGEIQHESSSQQEPKVQSLEMSPRTVTTSQKGVCSLGWDNLAD